MTTRNTHHTSDLTPAYRYPSPDELRAHVARGKQMQAEAVAAGLAAAARHLTGALGASWRWLVTYNRRAETRRALMACSDRTLADIGIPREQIDLVARRIGHGAGDPQPVDLEALTWRARWAALLERLNAAQRRRREQLRVYRELMDYSDHELDDLGINRRDVPAIARTA